MKNKSKLKIGFTTGDINGIGIELTLRTFQETGLFESIIPILFGSRSLFNYYARVLDIKMKIETINSVSDAKPFIINCINIWHENVSIQMGKKTKKNGIYAYKSLHSACKALKNNQIDALVTCPINKEIIQSDKFKFPGHTEFLASYFENNTTMIMINDSLKICMVTNHCSLDEVSKKITKENITKTILSMEYCLTKDFEIPKPKIAILGLNPHNGDNGLFGRTELEIIEPTLLNMFNKGHYVFGPFAADGFFGSGAYQNYDGIVAMYHDQALIPFKLLSFGYGVNFTAGLDVIRTSPDHGTAYSLVGKKTASISSFRNSIYLAKDIWKRRNYNIYE